MAMVRIAGSICGGAAGLSVIGIPQMKNRMRPTPLWRRFRAC
jgi:hypothetical protein